MSTFGVGDRRLEITVTVKVIRPDGTVEASLTDSRLEGCGNPAFTSRVAHRFTEAISDAQRGTLGERFGEVDPAWKQDTA